MPISAYLKNLRQKVGHELLLVPSVAAVIFDEQNRILYQLRSEDGTWSLPAGAIDPDETPAQAVVREVAEETGLEVSVERLLGVYGGEGFTWSYPNSDVVQYTVVVFLCKITGGMLAAVDGESAELRFCHLREAPPLKAPFPMEIFQPPYGQALYQALPAVPKIESIN